MWAARQHGQRGFQKTVAFKTILPHLADNSEFEKMFLDEARIAAGIHHPNVVDIYELGEEGHVLYLAMEWVNGDSLVHVLKGIASKQPQAIDVRIAARIVADACAGLHAAHEMTDDDGKLPNVVHRDVSPHNIMVSLEGTVKMTDFGVAKAYGQSHQATTAGQVKGKVAYMAPEHIGGTTFDRRADVFAMGCVLYETTTGVLPFKGGNDPQTMQAVLRGTYEPPSKLVKGYPAELASIIDRALAPEPRNRYATAERMRVALEEWLARSSGTVVTATQVGSLVRQRLGPELDKRRDHVKAAIAMLQGGDSGPKSVQPSSSGGHTPASHSGVVSTGQQPALPPPLPPMRDRATSVPQAPSAMYAPAMAPQAPAALPVLPATAAGPPSGAKYAIAAVAGVAFAMLIGGIALAVWIGLRPHGEPATVVVPAATATAIATPTAITTAAATATPTTTAATTPTTTASTADQVPTAAPVTSTIDVTDLPTVKPAWTPPPPPPRGGAAAPPPPATTNKPVALPANPY